MYTAVADEEHNVTIHAGDRSCPVIAIAKQCLAQDGVTDIHFTVSGDTVRLEHVHRLLPFFHGKTLFEVGGKKYHWKGQTALLDDQTGQLLAGFHATYLETDYHRLGNLVVTEEGKKTLDLVVISALVLQERSDEGKLAREMKKLQTFRSSGGLMY
jgi:hypothetical protein